MKQLLNNCLKNKHLSKIRILAHAIFKQNCLLCNGNIEVASLKYPRAEHPSVEHSNAGHSRVGLQANAPRHPVPNAFQATDSPCIHAVCRACLNDLPWQPKSACPQCGLPSGGQVCGSCLNNPPDFDATHAVFLYDYPIDAMMVRYKYGNMLSLNTTFGQFLAEKIMLDASNNHPIDLIIAMPMHPTRLKERGFNQADEIAKVLTSKVLESKELTSKYRAKLVLNSVERIKLTPPQASLPLKDRVKNIKGAFKVNADLTGKRVAIIDDVMTTGASLNELAKTLKKAGASHVACWVLARTLPHQ